MAEVNLSNHNLIKRRLVKDHVYAIGGLGSLTIAKEFVLSARAARKCCHAFLLEKQKERKQTKKNEKRKLHEEEVSHLEARKK